MINSCDSQFKAILDIYSEIKPELYLKLVGNEDLSEFHHTLWTLPFYQKIVHSSSNFNTNKYLFVSDRNVSSSNLFFLYELSYSKYSLKGTFIVEKRIIDINEKPKEFKESLAIVLSSIGTTDIPFDVVNYTTML